MLSYDDLVRTMLWGTQIYPTAAPNEALRQAHNAELAFIRALRRLAPCLVGHIDGCPQGCWVQGHRCELCEEVADRLAHVLDLLDILELFAGEFSNIDQGFGCAATRGPRLYHPHPLGIKQSGMEDIIYANTRSYVCWCDERRRRMSDANTEARWAGSAACRWDPLGSWASEGRETWPNSLFRISMLMRGEPFSVRTFSDAVSDENRWPPRGGPSFETYHGGGVAPVFMPEVALIWADLELGIKQNLSLLSSWYEDLGGQIVSEIHVIDANQRWHALSTEGRTWVSPNGDIFVSMEMDFF